MISVVIPARDEAATVSQMVDVCLRAADEVVVVDDGSADGTGAVASGAGARVVPGPGRGKGAAMRAGLAATSGNLVVFADADVTSLGPEFVRSLAAPLLERDEVVFVKGRYERPGAGGRVNELAARPLLDALFPALGFVEQPLGGEYAGRRPVLEALSFEPGYGVDVGLLLDVYARYGVGAIAQVDLGVRVHRNRPLSELKGPAAEVVSVILGRAGIVAPSARRLA